MKRIVILTATRAEFGILRPLMERLSNNKNFDIQIVVTGMHLSPEFGLTIREIEKSGIKIDKKIEILMSSGTPAGLGKTMGIAMISFSDYFTDCKPDALIVLGDRYEVLSVACVAMVHRIPIFHIAGGEATEGLIDESIRNAITKMSYLHFTTQEVYRRRVIQMGESPDRVFNVGSMQIDNILNMEFYTLSELENFVNFNLGNRFAVGTFHPVTLENDTAEEQTQELLKAIGEHSDIRYLFTKANSDTEGRIINEMLAEYSSQHENLLLVDSLGTKGYLSALKYSSFVIGNSSSGIAEAPSFHIPTINIGNRQKGRNFASSIIQCEPNCKDISKAIDIALSDDFKDKVKKAVNPNGTGGTSEKIENIITDAFEKGSINLEKSFFDIDFTLSEI